MVSRKRLSGLCAVVTSVFASGWVLAAEPQPEVPAEWRSHEVMMTYTGVTSLYSCDGLEWKLKYLLKAAGARPDASVRATCSNPMGRPSRFVNAWLKFSTLALPGAPLAPGEKPDAKRAPPQPAVGEWRAVRFAERKPRDLEAGDCELVEQFDRELLPYFTVRERKAHMTCIPHQIRPSGIDLAFEVLAPPVAAKAGESKR
jgi:hypothetical protein